jgi:hypothetical protein
MKGTVSVLVSTLLMGYKHAASQDQTLSSPAHVRSAFQFKLSVPLGRAAPLFGPEAERCWAGQHWNPEFLHPQPAKDVEGAVFTLQHGSRKSVWVNTLFDSLIADPLFVNAENYNFALRQGSPTANIGFQPIVVDAIGPRVPVGPDSGP